MNEVISFLSVLFTGGHMEHQHIHWYGQSAFRIEDGAIQIYIDPFKLPEGLPKADVIFITHAHFDHFSMEDITKIKVRQTIIVAPKDVASQFEDSAVAVIPGNKYIVEYVYMRQRCRHTISIRSFILKKTNGWVIFLHYRTVRKYIMRGIRTLFPR